MLKAFSPVIKYNSKILILGSMPGKASLEQQQYYAFKRNQFWSILYELFNEELSDNYDNRLDFLLNHHIALWDVLMGCDREGSLDTNIKNEVPNDFNEILHHYPNIEYIFFNGSKAYSLFRKYIGFDYNRIKTYITLPSTSPANTQKLSYKMGEWQMIKDLLN